MKEIIDLLKTYNVEELCSLYKLKKFQASVLCDEYNRLKKDEEKAMSMEVTSTNQSALMAEIVTNISTGAYLEPEIINQMARKYVAKKIEKSDDRISFMIEDCGMSEEQVEDFLEKYNEVCKNKNELTMAANFDKESKANELLDELVSIYSSNEEKSVTM